MQKPPVQPVPIAPQPYRPTQQIMLWTWGATNAKKTDRNDPTERKNWLKLTLSSEKGMVFVEGSELNTIEKGYCDFNDTLCQIKKYSASIKTQPYFRQWVEYVKIKEPQNVVPEPESIADNTEMQL